MLDDGAPYRVLLATFALLAVGAVLLGSVGLYAVLTGGTTDGAAEVDVLGEFDCETFDGDPGVAHEASYDVERTVLSGTEVESIERNQTDDGTRFEVEMAGTLLDASASRADGTQLPVEQPGDGNRVVVEADGTAPFRLWVDSVTEDATVTRTQLDVCPPA